MLVRRPVGERLVVDEKDLVDFTETVLAFRFKSGCVLVAEERLLLLLCHLVRPVEEMIAPPIVLDRELLGRGDGRRVGHGVGMDSELLCRALPSCQLRPFLAGRGRAVVLGLFVLLTEDLSPS